MGGACSTKIEERTVIFCGLKGVGKTCLLYSMKLGRQAKDWHETNAYNYEVVPYTSRSKVSYKFHCWDLAGKEELRPLWKCFYNHTAVHFLLFVIDASDRKRCTDMGACVRARCQPLLRLSDAHVLLTPPPSTSLSLSPPSSRTARPIFQWLINETKLRRAQIIVVANRRAVTRHSTDTTMHPDEIRDALAIDNDFSARQVLIHYVDAKKSTGLKSLRDRLCDDIVDS